jgi:hypothetical protein
MKVDAGMRISLMTEISEHENITETIDCSQYPLGPLERGEGPHFHATAL